MSGIDVLDLVLEQIGNLRIPIREHELRDQIVMIGRNLEALRAAMERQGKGDEDNVPSRGNDDNPVEG